MIPGELPSRLGNRMMARSLRARDAATVARPPSGRASSAGLEIPKGPPMNGAESLVHSLLKSGVDTCFCNPGTSEMHFVAALDRVPGMRCILGLFEGVVTGAADGYARMSG